MANQTDAGFGLVKDCRTRSIIHERNSLFVVRGAVVRSDHAAQPANDTVPLQRRAITRCMPPIGVMLSSLKEVW